MSFRYSSRICVRIVFEDTSRSAAISVTQREAQQTRRGPNLPDGLEPRERGIGQAQAHKRGKAQHVPEDLQSRDAGAATCSLEQAKRGIRVTGGELDQTAPGEAEPVIAASGHDGARCASVVAAVSLVGLILYERPKPEALIPMELFGNRVFTAAILTLLSGVLAAGATMFTASLFLQNYRGLTPLEAGLFMMLMAVASMVAALLAGKLVAKGRAREVLLAAGAIIAVAGACFWITSDGIVWFMLIAFFIMGIGFGGLNDPVNVTAISQLPNEKAGLAASLISMSRQIGQVLGVAIAGALIGTNLGADMKSGFAQAAVPVWVLLIIAGAVIFLINAFVRSARTIASAPGAASSVGPTA